MAACYPALLPGWPICSGFAADFVRKMQSGFWISDVDPNMIKYYIDNLKALLYQGELCERKAFIHSFVQRIIVSRHDVKLIYTMPMIPNVLELTEGEVLHSVRYGGPLWTRTRDPSLIRTVL